jgi:dienelactone hydrolase
LAQQLQATVSGHTLSSEFHPATTTPVKGAVVIAYGSDGLTDQLNGPWATMIRDYAESIAALGFHALIPDYLGFTKTAPGIEALELIPQRRSQWEQALSAAIDQAAAQASVPASSVGLVGFSLGGHLCLRLRHRVKVLVSFFAPVLDGLGSAGTLRVAQIHHGTADSTPGTGYENAGVIQKLLQSEGATVDLHAYPGAGHGFSGADAANQQARQQSKSNTLTFLAANL